MYPRGRPHLKQRRTTRLLNFGVRFAFAIIDFFAMVWVCTARRGSGIPASGPLGLDYGNPSLWPFFSQLVRRLTLTKKRASLRGSRILREAPPTVKYGRKEECRDQPIENRRPSAGALNGVYIILNYGIVLHGKGEITWD